MGHLDPITHSMFTGIIEAVGTLESIQDEGTNRIFHIRAALDGPIKVDQSIAHNGCCLTVTDIFENPEQGEKFYSVTMVEETLIKTNLGELTEGVPINIERCLRVGDRLDGHFVQGHVDGTGKVVKIEDRDGSWLVDFTFDPAYSHLIVEKGSICINGVSLTAFNAGKGTFSVTIIPFTWEHTQFQALKEGDTINLEFDILGKYILKAQGLGM